MPDRRLILTHGFTQNVDCWGFFDSALSTFGHVIKIDGPGHGRSAHDDADLVAAAELTTSAGGAGIYVGYSMGGRVALHAALQRPELVTGLVLIGATAGIETAKGRAERRAADNALADRLLSEGLPAFMDRWLALPLFRGLSEEQAAKPQRLTNRVEGLAASLRNCGTGTQEPLWERLETLRMPVLVIAGDQDRKFSDIGRRMVERINEPGHQPDGKFDSGPQARLALIPGTHPVHLERPVETAELIGQTIEAWAGQTL